VSYLLAVSLLWAFSFGLIETHLSSLDSNLVAFLRLGLSLLAFLPFLRPRAVPPRIASWLVVCGALQFGVMYAAYIASYGYLRAYEVALFTILTPLYVTLLNDALEGRFDKRNLEAALMAVVGTGVVVFQDVQREGLLHGFLLVQLANLCFALGQVWYRKLVRDPALGADSGVFAWLYLGAVLVTAPLGMAGIGGISELSRTQWLVLGYLGVIASGLGFFLWNTGARRVGAGTLAVFNNLKIPLGIAVALLVFGESTELTRLMLGGAIILLGLWWARRGEGSRGLKAPAPARRAPTGRQ